MTRYKSKRTRQYGPVRVIYTHREVVDWTGRFGGGWMWALGVEAGTLTRRRGTIIVSLLVSSVRIDWSRS